MLLRLVRTYLRPYAAPLAVVVALQFVGTMAALYLPSLNADIIDRGVVTGDTGYIVRHGGLMLAVSLVQIVCSVDRRLVLRAQRDGLRSRPARRDLPPGRHVLARARCSSSARPR